jgi:hypothetical protein
LIDATVYSGIGKINEVTPEMSAQLMAFWKQYNTSFSNAHVYPISGAAGRVPKDATPWAHRDAKYAGVSCC